MGFINKVKKVFCGINTDKRPNIFLILLDQYRNDAREEHQVFDYMASQGVLFSTTITYAPYTLASCHATFTGMYGKENGVNAYTKSDQFDERGCYTIAQYLSDAGYHTRAYTFSPILIPHSGFDSFTSVSEDDETDILTSHFNEIDEVFEREEPCFSYLHYGEIHHDIVREVIKKYDNFDEDYFGEPVKNRQRYRKFARQAGDYLDAVLSYIKEKDEEDNSLIIVMTDHGSSNGEKPGEKAYGTFTYDYSINVWHYWLWPKHLPSGLEITSQVRTIDILPTLLDLLELKGKKGKKPAMGGSLVPMISEGVCEERLAFSETGGVDGAFPSPDSPNIRCVRDGSWKLIQNCTTNQFELYNLLDDPSESNNLYGKEVERGEALWHKMTDYIF